MSLIKTSDSLKDCQGALAAQKTSDEEARRRWPISEDEDGQAIRFLPPYLVDARCKLLPSKALRRLEDKTQVMTAPKNAHIRHRSSHTAGVVSLASTIAWILGLNADLCEAIAWAHDIGHPPFGHVGEKVLTKMSGKEFRHEIFGAVLAQHIERKGRFNLTRQVLLGIRHHSRRSGDNFLEDGLFPEANIVMLADKIDYLFADYNDIFLRTSLQEDDYPELKRLINHCGATQRKRVAFCVKNLCLESATKDKVAFVDSKAAQLISQIKPQMYQLYKLVNIAENEAPRILERLYEFITRQFDDLDPVIVIALMTDADVLALYEKDCLSANDLNNSSVGELIPYLRGKQIDFANPDLDW